MLQHFTPYTFASKGRVHPNMIKDMLIEGTFEGEQNIFNTKIM
jgi:hypothetical protein